MKKVYNKNNDVNIDRHWTNFDHQISLEPLAQVS